MFPPLQPYGDDDFKMIEIIERNSKSELLKSLAACLEANNSNNGYLDFHYSNRIKQKIEEILLSL